MRGSWLILVVVLVFASGCGRFAARRIVQAPNSYPAWLAPKAPVALAFSEKLLTTFTNHYLEVSSPPARIRYRIIDPADYQFRWTNRVDETTGQFNVSFTASIDALNEKTNLWSQRPRGTVILLHGYGVSGFAMLPWAFLLGEQGWRCVLVDLRGHGKSTGDQIYFGTREDLDLRALLDQLAAQQALDTPVAVVGHSYGGVLALRLKMTDARVGKVVAMSPYADLSRAILNVSEQYASWVPKAFLKAGLRKLPELLRVPPCELNPECWLAETGALFIAGQADKIAPLDQVRHLYETAGPGNKMLVVPRAAHEPLPFFFDDLVAPITSWLSEQSLAENTALNRSGAGPSEAGDLPARAAAVR